MMRRGSTLETYEDGTFANTTVGSNSSIANAGSLSIGAHDGLDPVAFLNGQIDDVRVYNYALTTTQIRTLYNENSAVRFGPLTGSP